MPRKELLVALRATLVTLVLTGIAYPLLTTGVALALFPGRARGSLVADEQGRVIGSELIAQPMSALWQAPRIARARGVAPERVRAVLEANVEGRDLLVLGEPRVNVLLVNLALDRLFGRPPPLAGR